jgi:hypothetical protein
MFKELIQYSLWAYLALDGTIVLGSAIIGEWGYFVVFLGYGLTTLGLILEAWKWL